MSKNELEQIAKKHLRIDTLQEQKSDRLDFHELHVTSIKEALQAAFIAGQNSKSTKRG